MEWYYIVLIVLLSIIVLYVILDLVVSYFLVRILIDPYCKPLDEAIEADVGFGKLVNKNEYYDYYKKIQLETNITIDLLTSGLSEERI